VPIQSVVIRSPEELKPVVKGKRKSSPSDAKAAEDGPTAAPANPKGKKVEEIRGVFVIVNGLAEFRRVKPGISSDTDFEIAGELKPGEKVIIGPHKTLRTLKPGQKVKIEAPKKPKGKEQS
jgi:HlyD family secretion protein